MLFQTATGVMKAAKPKADLFQGEQLPSIQQLQEVLLQNKAYRDLLEKRERFRQRHAELVAEEEKLRQELRESPQGGDEQAVADLISSTDTTAGPTIAQKLRAATRDKDVHLKAVHELDLQLREARNAAADSLRLEARQFHARLTRNRMRHELILSRMNRLESDLFALSQAIGVSGFVVSGAATPNMGTWPDPNSGSKQRLRELVRTAVIDAKTEQEIIRAAEKAPLLVH